MAGGPPETQLPGVTHVAVAAVELQSMVFAIADGAASKAAEVKAARKDLAANENFIVIGMFGVEWGGKERDRTSLL